MAVHFYKERGFIPWAMANFLILLGWSNPDSREIFSKEELINEFSLEGVNRANSVFDIRVNDPKFFTDPKAISINTHYLRNMPVEEILPYVRDVLERERLWNTSFECDKHDWFVKTVELIRSRCHLLTDFASIGRPYFSDDFFVEPDSLQKNILKHPGLKEWFAILADRFEALNTFSVLETERIVRELAEELGVKAGVLINGIRTAVTGQAAGPGLFDLLVAIGQCRVVDRLRKALLLFTPVPI